MNDKIREALENSFPFDTSTPPPTIKSIYLLTGSIFYRQMWFYTHRGLLLRVSINEVGGDGHGELATKLLALKALQGVPFAVGAQQCVELVLRHWVVGWRDARSPPQC